MKRWQLANPERAKFNAMRSALRRRVRLDAGGPLPTAADLRDLFASYSGLCVYCLAPATAVDHVEPVARGGSNSIANLVPACAGCNGSKKDRPLLVWLSRRAA